jgi:hypothetical protein
MNEVRFFIIEINYLFITTSKRWLCYLVHL